MAFAFRSSQMVVQRSAVIVFQLRNFENEIRRNFHSFIKTTEIFRKNDFFKNVVEKNQMACCSSVPPEDDNLKRIKSKISDKEPPPATPLSKNVAKRVKVVVKPKTDTPLKTSKFISTLRAMNEYSLKETDLVGLAQLKRRSAYIGDPPTIMFYESDVEKRAINVHGSREGLRKAQRRAKINQKNAVKNVTAIRKFFGDFDEQSKTPFTKKIRQTFGGIWREGRVVVIAICINSLNCACKFTVGWWTGSHSMIAEGIHSLMDTINQMVLAFGIHQSIKKPDKYHPYGYMNVRHVTSLISGVAFFCMGAGLSCYHGFQGLIHPEPLQPLFWAFATLGFSLSTEGGTLVMAFKEVRKKAREENMTMREYIRHGDDPSLNVVLFEDLASVLGVSIAAASLGLSLLFNSSLPDACGSIAIGSLLGAVASFIIYTNSDHLVGRSMPEDEKEVIVSDLESDPIIRSVQDVKTTELGGDKTRFKAEVDLNGYEITRVYLQSQDLEKILQEVQSFESAADLENFLLTHGEQIVDCVGAELDRIEKLLKVKHPDVTHMDLEVL